MTVSLSDHICFKLYVASRLIIRGFDDDLSPLQLTYPKYLVMLALGDEDGQTVGVLAERLSLDFGTLSPLLKSLAATGYVLRQRQEADERVVLSFLTPSGRDALEKAKAVAVKLFCDTELTQEQFRELHALADVFIDRCKHILSAKKDKRALSGAAAKSSPKRRSAAAKAPLSN